MSVEKICRICGWDCSACERVRDSHGNYYCKPCHEEALARKGAASSGSLAGLSWAPDIEDAADDDLPANDPTRLVVATKLCPECGYALTAKAILCTACGLDFRTGDHKEAELIGRAELTEDVPVQRVWPLLLGLTTVAVSGLVGWGFVAKMLEFGRVRHMLALAGAIVCLFGLAVCSIGLISGVNLARRRQLGIDQARAWSIITVTLAVIIGGCALGLGQLADPAALEAARLGHLKSMPFASIAGAILIAAIWPACLLIGFTIPAVRRQIYHHWT